MSGIDADQQPQIQCAEDLDKEQRQMLYQQLGLFEKGYTIGVLNMATTLAVVLRWPEHFWILYVAKSLIFLPWRFRRFRRRNMEWYMMDFCYFVTYYSVICIVLAAIRTWSLLSTPLYHHNLLLLRMGFAFTNGAMVWSVPLFGNKLVFHDIDNTTSVFIHLSPALFFWCLRWGGGFGTSRTEHAWPGMFEVCEDMEEADIAVKDVAHAFWYSGPCAANISDFALWGPLFWIFLWGLPYFLIMFCCLKGYLKRNSKEYLYTHTLQQRGGAGAVLAKLPDALKPLGFMLEHFVFVFVFGFFSAVLWNSFVTHTLLLLSVLLCAVHNGSTFMFRVVAARHVNSIVAQAAKSSASCASCTEPEADMTEPEADMTAEV